MIDIIEKEPYKSYDSWNNRNCLMYPVIMVKDDKEYFILNRREPQESYRDDDNKKIIEQLKENDGLYATFYSSHKQPIQFLKNIIDKRYTFDKTFKTIEEASKINFMDFSGNLVEISSAFMYRVYDTKLIEDIKQIVNLIESKQWEEAEMQIRKKEKEYEKLVLSENEEIEQ